MITVTTQGEFDLVVNNTPSNEMVLIKPNSSGNPYELKSLWSIPSGAFIRGENNPLISFVGTYDSTTLESGAIHSVGSSGAEKEDIRLEGFTLELGTTLVGTLNGIYTDYVGKSFTTGLTTGNASLYDSSTNGVSKVNKVGIQLKNVTVKGFKRGVYLKNSANCKVVLCDINSSNFAGINLVKSSNNIITGNTSQNNSGYGINLSNVSNNNVVTGNTVQNNNSVGIILATSSNNNTVTGNTIQNNKAQGISLNTSNNNTIMGNTAQNNNSVGIILATSSNNNTVTGNTSQNNNSSGIHLQNSSSNNTVTGNTTQNNDSSGISLSSSNNNTITGNTSQNNGSTGIYLNSSNYVIMYGNVTKDNGTANTNTDSTGVISDVKQNKFL